MNLSKSSILHSFIFSIFPIIYIYSINTIEVSANEIILPIVISVLITSLFLLVSRLILRDWTKSGLIVSLLLVLSFSYGHLYKVVNSSVLASQDVIIRHTYLLPLFLAVFIIGTILIIRTSIRLDKVKTIVNVVAITLIVITIPNFVFSETPVLETINNKNFENVKFEYNLKNLSELNLGTNPPDVYYIILDGYGGTNRMKQDLNFDNYDFLSELTKRGFFAPDISSSNYPTTGWSLPSSLNMNYLPVKDDNQSEIEYKFLIDEMNEKNEVMRNFDYLNYEIIEYRTYVVFPENPAYVDQVLCQKDKSTDSKFNNVLLRTTILGFFTNHMNLNADRETMLCAFDKLSTLGENNEKPIFAFMHFLIPHPPYLFGPNGEDVIGGKSQTVEGSFVGKDQYIGSIKYANKRILENVDKILEKNKNSIIVIQSDHGYDFGINYENPSEISLKQRFSNLNAIYLPGKGKDGFYQGITPVNTFRIIFNNYFDASYKMLDNKMYYSPYGEHTLYKNTEFNDVTKVILN